ncbi:hypothetical protein [Micromonospora chersina]|uniref:hypothetical protein n=1 Tax=Micromonospora chersina TaxID=47854 RepID=UPI00339F5016
MELKVTVAIGVVSAALAAIQAYYSYAAYKRGRRGKSVRASTSRWASIFIPHFIRDGPFFESLKDPASENRMRLVSGMSVIGALAGLTSWGPNLPSTAPLVAIATGVALFILLPVALDAEGVQPLLLALTMNGAALFVASYYFLMWPSLLVLLAVTFGLTMTRWKMASQVAGAVIFGAFGFLAAGMYGVYGFLSAFTLGALILIWWLLGSLWKRRIPVEEATATAAKAARNEEAIQPQSPR